VAFKGWPVEALEFFEGLEADNSKSYWQANKAAYETLVRGPMEELVAELEPDWGDGHVFRPYRDVRFSKDKSPYKTNIAAVVGDGYIQLTANGLGVGSGMYQLASDQLERYRQAVVDDRAGKRLEALLTKTREAGIRAEGHDFLKTTPRGYPKDHPRAELLRYKGLITWREWPPAAWLGTRKAKDRIVAFLEDSKPLNAWLRTNVGPSELPEERRR
jgi:uncharacterized protein (TIGR02453 family)